MGHLANFFESDNLDYLYNGIQIAATLRALVTIAGDMAGVKDD